MMLHRLENLLIAIWIGAMVGVGYIAAPVLFAVLDDRTLAGMLAGKMFYIVGVIGLISGGLLLILRFKQESTAFFLHWRGWLLCLMLLFVGIIFFVLQPMIVDLKALGITEGSAEARKFGLLHGISSVLYLLTTISGATLIFMGMSRKDSKTDHLK